MTITTEAITTESFHGDDIVVVREVRDNWTLIRAIHPKGYGRTSLSRLTEAEAVASVIAECKRAVVRYEADELIRPHATDASLDYGSHFDARINLVEVADIADAKVGDQVWVWSYQVWRRGVVEKVGRTNLTVAVVVKSTGTFSRQSVKPGRREVYRSRP